MGANGKREMKRRNQPKRFTDSEIEEAVKKNEGVGIAKLAEFLGVDASGLETRLYDVVNVCCDDKGKLFYHKWQ